MNDFSTFLSLSFTITSVDQAVDFLFGCTLLESLLSKKTEKRLQALQTHLAAVTVQDHNPAINVQPAASRVPVLAPPLYPGVLDTLAAHPPPPYHSPTTTQTQCQLLLTQF